MPAAADLAGDTRLREEFKQVDGYVAQGLSVTEMEMRHAVLERIAVEPVLVRQSFFFFRDPAFTDALRSRLPGTTLTDGEDHGLSATAKMRAAEGLSGLRRRIETAMQGNPPQVYADEKDLGDRVSAAFTAFLDACFPPETVGSEQLRDPALQEAEKLDEEQRLQARYAQGNIAEYVEREGWGERIASLAADSRPAVITGAVGSGKSTLMAVAIAYIQQQPNAPEALYHFCGGTADSGRLPVILRRLIAELQRAAGQLLTVPTSDVELPPAMIGALFSIPQAKRVLLAIDALDQLDEHKELSWLPARMPANVKLLLSVKSLIDNRQNPLVAKLERFSPRILEVGLLSVKEREAIIAAFLRRYGKRIDAVLLTRIAADKESETPLVLRALLEEMRLIGDHHALVSQVERYIETDSAEAFFGRVLERIEGDFGIRGDNRRGAAEILALVTASVRGLAEGEILELMNPGGGGVEAFTPLQWAGLHEVLRPHVKEQNGCIVWSHDMVRRAAAMRYEPEMAACHRRLAEYFLDSGRMLGSHGLQEWSWHLRLLDERERMEALFRQGRVCAALLKENEGEAHGHWLWLAQGQKSPADWIAKSAERWVEEEWEDLWDLERLRNYLTELVGRPEQAVVLGRRIVEERVRVLGNEAWETIAAKMGLAASYQSLNRHEEALRLFEEVLEQRTRLQGPDALDTISAKHNLANSYDSLNRHEEALRLREEVLGQRTRLLNPDALDTIAAKYNLAASFQSIRKNRQACQLMREVYAARLRILGPSAYDTLIAQSQANGFALRSTFIGWLIASAIGLVLKPFSPLITRLQKRLFLWASGKD